MRSRGRPLLIGGALLGLLLAGVSGPTATAGRTQPGAPAGVTKLQAGQVTLLTGDRVTVDEQGAVRTVPGPNRKVGFEQKRVGKKLYVIPSDVSAAVAAGKLDRALFDVAGLIRQKLDDASTKEVPLLVGYDGKAKARPFAAATIERRLPAINSVALRVAKRDAAKFLPQLSGAGVGKVWLDARYRPTLDKSVPQIGAPAAWQAGFTGTGVSVAVLDTGIDSEHPDLKTQVAGRKNFTDEPDRDLVGHGTHVASTLAGTGAASGGKYRGVAPGARLYDGKVCAEFGCPASSILAGMEWAATEVKAKVVNMSLGGDAGPEIDPIEAAVARLTEQTGTLFVIAAGNSGEFGPGTIESPGRAAAALTVGAVDKQDQLAAFSSRGPLPDGTMKPDLTAPGVAIMAARAAGISSGDGDYLSADGTSMATPHAAGAAALLAQQHPDWKAARIKSGLMSAAKPLSGQSGDEQGTGRLDVANAVAFPVVAETGSLYFGKAVWPHGDDEPITKKVAFRNDGDQPVELTLSTTLLGPGDQPAPDGMVELGAAKLIVPAHATADVPVTVNTRLGPDGRFSGQVTGKAGDRTVTASIAVDKEIESYNLTVEHLGPDGKPSPAMTTYLGSDSWESQYLQDPSGTTTVRVPKAKYVLDSKLELGTNTYLMVQPLLELTADTTVVMDSRLARPLQISARSADAALVSGAVGLRMSDDWRGSTWYEFTGPAGVFTAQIGSARAEDTGFVATIWARRNAAGRLDNSPYLLSSADVFRGRFPTGFQRVLDPAAMIPVDQTILATSNRRAEVYITGRLGLYAAVDYDLPARRRVFHDAVPDDLGGVSYTGVGEFDPGPERIQRTDVNHINPRYQAGRRYQEQYNAAVFAPSSGLALRLDDFLQIRQSPLADAADRSFGGSYQQHVANSKSTKLFRDGRLVASDDSEFGNLNVGGLPAGEATFKLVSTMDRTSISRLTSKLEHVWTFRTSAATSDAQWLPILAIRLAPEVNDRNVTPRRPVTTVPVHIRPPFKGSSEYDESVLAGIQRVSIEYQAGAGAPWRSAKVVRKAAGRYVAAFPTPSGESVSLRATVVDAAGNITEQTVTDAMRYR
ncbi:S8 family serine peptidase [Kribbella sp. NPDC005582]|uniref:S8 family serine peptidase n=1 Tax=Kribbella sp. NPDC005582 TaxID=3156893 RepID=UPI00339DCF29